MSLHHDCYRWIDPWEEMERFDDYLQRERDDHNEAMRRAYRAMADENQRDRHQIQHVMSKMADVTATQMKVPSIWPNGAE